MQFFGITLSTFYSYFV